LKQLEKIESDGDILIRLDKSLTSVPPVSDVSYR
jgi:hypothetical protein